MSDNIQEFIKSRNGAILLGQIISMLKGIEFIDKPKLIEDWNKLKEIGYAQHSSFMVNITPQHYLSFHLAWKRRSIETQEIIAGKFILYFDELSKGDRKSFCETIQKTVKNILLQIEVFNLNKISENNNSLFSILYSDNPINSVEILFYLIYFELKNSIADWIVIYPMQSILSKSFQLEFDGICLYEPKDEFTWGNITCNYENAKSWHPLESQSLKPRRNGAREPKFNYTQFPNSTWLICESRGTCDGVRENAAVKMRTFIAALFSHSYLLSNILVKNSEIPQTYCKQFPANNNQTGLSEMNASIGEIIPSIGSKLIISEAVLTKLVNWYEKRENLQDEKKRRVQVASQFIHYGIIADGLERFMHFFIALDALFGKRGDVERLITEGIKTTFPNEAIWQYKISRLFDLRSELVHGSCSSISEWKELDAYCRHTKSNPLWDVTIAAMTAFQNI